MCRPSFPPVCGLCFLFGGLFWVALGALCPPSPQWPAFNSCCYASYDPLSCLSFNQLNEEGACRAVGFLLLWLGCCLVGGARRCGVFWFSRGRHDALLRIAACSCLTGLRDTQLSSRLRSRDAAILGQAALVFSLSVGFAFCGGFVAVLGLVWRGFALALPSPPVACS